MLLTVPGFSQDPARNPDKVYPPKPSEIEDCDRYGRPYCSLKRNKPTYDPHAGHFYSLIWAKTGLAGPNPSPADAISAVDSTQTNSPEKRLGYNTAICAVGTEQCLAVDDDLTEFIGRPWCRYNDLFFLWIQEDCRNVRFVPDTLQTGRGVIPSDPKIIYRDTGKVKIVYRDTGKVECCTSKVEVKIECCEPGKFKWVEIYLALGHRTTFSTDLSPEYDVFGIGAIQYFGDSSMNGAYFVGSEAFFLLRKPFICPEGNCHEFTDKNFLSPAVRWEVFGGRRFDVWDTKWHLDLYTKYTLIQPRTALENRWFLPKKSGWTVGFNAVWEPVNGVEIKGGPQYDLFSKQGGGMLRADISFSTIADANKKRQQRDSTRGAERDNIRRAEQLRQDTVEVDSFLRTSPMSIFNLIDTTSTDTLSNNDTLQNQESKRFLFLTFKPEGQKQKEELKQARTKMRVLQDRYNLLLAEVQQYNVSKWREFKQVRTDLYKASKRLDRLEEKQRKKAEKEKPAAE